jgi:hypothetical protein
MAVAQLAEVAPSVAGRSDARRINLGRLLYDCHTIKTYEFNQTYIAGCAVRVSRFHKYKPGCVSTI